MKIWKWLGWDTKEARTERNYDNNKHSTYQWLIFMVGLCVFGYLVWR